MNARLYTFLVLLGSSLFISGCGSNTGGSSLATTNTAALNFPGTRAGVESVPQTVILTNHNHIPLAITNVTVTGPDAGAFQLFNQCGSSVPRFGSCSIQVVCDPAKVGAVTATMVIADSATNSPQAVSLSGTGSESAAVDVLVYGATPSGILAAIEAAKHGKQVVVLEPSQHVGGMSSNGLSASDLYEPKDIGGLGKDFYDRINAHYGNSGGLVKGRFFEPHVAEQVFQAMLGENLGLTVLFGVSLNAVTMAGTAIDSLTTAKGDIYRAKEFIDASYTGDLMAAAGVSYSVGREPAAQYNESFGGIGKTNRLRETNIDPYVNPKDPASGLIAHVTQGPIGALGEGDKAVMAYNYRVCLSSDPKNQIPFAPPANYDPAEFELLLRLLKTNVAPQKLSDFFGMAALPNSKFDVNSGPPPSTDEVGPSFLYPDATAAERQQIAEGQKHYEQALFYFIATDPRVPQAAQQQMNSLGLCKDEFTDNGGWPRQIYVREARRMSGVYTMTQNDLQRQTSIQDPIGVGGYPIDDHVNYIFNNDGVVYYEVHSGVLNNLYPIPYRILTPQAAQATNLLVTVDVSASHVAFESLRVEIAYMIMGQAAGAAASLAIDGGTSVQNVDYGSLSKLLLGDGVIISP